jgi:Fe-Mn family superoxide dismutase
MKFTLPKLQYDFNAMEPYIDALTMKIHYEKHHAAYVDNLNKELEQSDLVDISLEDLLINISQYDDNVRNNAGGHYNHTFLWSIISPKKTMLSGKLANAIDKYFGSFESFKSQLSIYALYRFGSGWAWLCVDKNGNLFLTSTPNQDNTIMNIAPKQGWPILGIDVWEHAYYLKYQNKRAEYIEAFWNLINWEQVSLKFEEVTE